MKVLVSNFSLQYATMFLFSTSSRPPILWVPGAPSTGVKRPGPETDHSPPSSAEVKNCGLLRRDNFTLPFTLKKGKAITVTGREDPQGCETSGLPRFLDNRLTDGGEVVSVTRQPPLTPQDDSWYSFLLEAESTPGP
jgi:hypothetical protein